MASGGPLDYGSKGVIWKTWENLKQFIGKEVPLVIGHPSDDDGDPRLLTAEDLRVGTVMLKACPKQKETLCGDVEFKEGAPLLGGYSIGFSAFDKKIGGRTVQDIVLIDHVAITDDPRNHFARMVASDSAEVVGDSAECGGTFIYADGIRGEEMGDEPSAAVLEFMVKLNGQMSEIAKQIEGDSEEDPELEKLKKERDALADELKELKKKLSEGDSREAERVRSVLAKRGIPTENLKEKGLTELLAVADSIAALDAAKTPPGGSTAAKPTGVTPVVDSAKKKHKGLPVWSDSEGRIVYK